MTPTRRPTSEGSAGQVLRFRAAIEIRGINPFVKVSRTSAARLQAGWRKPMPVLVRIDGQPRKAWRINMMPAGDGSFYLYLADPVRKASGTKVGDRVEVELAFDGAYHGGVMHPVPRWFSSALAKDAKAKAGWEALTPSRQKEVVRYLAALRSDEARERNLAKALAVLRGEAGRYMARDWKDGS